MGLTLNSSLKMQSHLRHRAVVRMQRSACMGVPQEHDRKQRKVGGDLGDHQPKALPKAGPSRSGCLQQPVVSKHQVNVFNVREVKPWEENQKGCEISSLGDIQTWKGHAWPWNVVLHRGLNWSPSELRSSLSNSVLQQRSGGCPR